MPSANQRGGQNGTRFFVYFKYLAYRGNFRHYELYLLVPNMHGWERVADSKRSQKRDVRKRNVYKVNGVTNSRNGCMTIIFTRQSRLLPADVYSMFSIQSVFRWEMIHLIDLTIRSNVFDST